MEGINELVCGIYFMYGLFSIFHTVTQRMDKSYMKLSLVCFITTSLMFLTLPTLFEMYIDKVNLISYMICLIFLTLWVIKYIKKKDD